MQAEEARVIIARVALEEGREDIPTLRWRVSRKHHSSGHFDPDEHRIVITAGTDERTHLHILLHECAHWLSPGLGPYAVWHSEAFWVTAWTLYSRWIGPGPLWGLAVESEARYRKTAMKVLDALILLRGCIEAWDPGWSGDLLPSLGSWDTSTKMAEGG